MENPEFSPNYYNTIDQIYHARWVANRLLYIDRLRTLIRQRWPDGHPSRLVLVAGTSGKGSTVRYLEAGLGLDGKSGALTSPHLFDYRERFRVGGEPPGRPEITEIWEDHIRPMAVERVRESPEHPLDYQDIAILIALHLFDRHGVEWGIVETGVGGRYDKTMALDAAAACLTNVGDDHEHLLGDQAWMRALEKGGVVRSGAPLITSERDPLNLEIFAQICEAAGAALVVVGEEEKSGLQRLLDLSGAESAANLLSAEHQKWNAALALAAIRALRPALDPQAVIRQFAGVHLPGRFWEVEPGLYADVAHNPNKTVALAEEIRAKYPDRGIILVAGVSGRRSPAAVLAPLLQIADTVVLTGVAHHGQLPEAVREAVLPHAGRARILVNPDPANALRTARAYRAGGEIILLTGSTFMIDQALNPDPYMRHLNSTYGWRNEARK